MRKHPPDFRRDETEYIMTRWRAGESCSLIGVGSVGKSNLLQHLTDPDIQQLYMNWTHQDVFKAIIIDPNLLGPMPTDSENAAQFRSWAGYELMMHRLYIAFYPFDVLDEDAVNFFETYQMLQDGNNPLFAYMGLRYFELGLEFFFRRGVRLVFMFDEFEEMLRQVPARFFQTLRALRDNHKEQLSFLTFTRTPLPMVINQLNLPQAEMEPFVELFTDNVYTIGPYNHRDARRMIERLLMRNQRQNYPDHLIQFLIYVSGGYAGLLRACYRMLDTLGDITVSNAPHPELINRLAQRSAVQAECSTIWKSLSPPEQDILKRLHTQDLPHQVDARTDRILSLLLQKSILRLQHQATMHFSIEPPVFRAYLDQIL